MVCGGFHHRLFSEGPADENPGWHHSSGVVVPFPFMAMAGTVDKFLLILAAVAVAWVLLTILKIIAAVSLWALAVILKGAVIVLAVAVILIVLWWRRDR